MENVHAVNSARERLLVQLKETKKIAAEVCLACGCGSARYLSPCKNCDYSKIRDLISMAYIVAKEPAPEVAGKHGEG